MRAPSAINLHKLVPGLATALVAAAMALSNSAPSAAQDIGERAIHSQAGPSPDAHGGQPDNSQPDTPVANPGRPTVSTPATLTPVGYLQFETGLLAAWHSPEFSLQQSLVQVTKFSLSRRLELLASTSPFVHSNTEPRNGTGDVTLGAQGIVSEGEGTRPTVALSYCHDVFSGGTPDLDIGSASNSGIVLLSADVKGFHYDTNYLFNEQVSDQRIRRGQFGQTLSISHGVGKKFGLAGELWHFSQPLLRGNATGNLWAVNYNEKKNLVFDAGFNRGLTATSTRWEIVAGFTYLLPERLHL